MEEEEEIEFYIKVPCSTDARNLGDKYMHAYSRQKYKSLKEEDIRHDVFTLKNNTIHINGETWFTNVHIGAEDNYIYYGKNDNRVLSWNGRIMYFTTFPNPLCVPCVAEFKSYLLK
jgi:hypothetical protein